MAIKKQKTQQKGFSKETPLRGPALNETRAKDVLRQYRLLSDSLAPQDKLIELQKIVTIVFKAEVVPSRAGTRYNPFTRVLMEATSILELSLLDKAWNQVLTVQGKEILQNCSSPKEAIKGLAIKIRLLRRRKWRSELHKGIDDDVKAKLDAALPYFSTTGDLVKYAISIKWDSRDSKMKEEAGEAFYQVQFQKPGEVTQDSKVRLEVSLVGMPPLQVASQILAPFTESEAQAAIDKGKAAVPQGITAEAWTLLRPEITILLRVVANDW